MENFDEIMPQILESTQIPAQDILSIRNVKKVNKHGKINKRILLMTARQIFLIEKRAFHRGLKISNPFPVSEISSIIVNKNQVETKFKDRTLLIADSTISEIYEPLSAYFKPILTPSEFSAKHLPETNASRLPSNTNPLYERLKLIFRSKNKTEQPPSQLRSRFADLLKADTIDFSSFDGFQNIADDILYTFMIMPNLKNLIIQKVPISWPALAKFISTNTTLIYLETHQEIKKDFSQFAESYASNNNIQLSSLNFSDSKFGPEMMDGLKMILEKNKLTHLTIKNELTELGYKQLFPLLINCSGFETVTHFDLSGCKKAVPESILLQLTNLTTLNLNNCSLDLCILLTDLNRSRSLPLVEVSVCENFCSENLDPSFLLSKSLKSFHANNVVWRGNSLQSFFTIVSQTKDLREVNLSLQGVQLNDWQAFDSFLQQTSNNNIVSLDFSNNPIYSGFCTFLNNSCKLTKLTLAGCFANGKTEIQIFAKYFGSNTYLEELYVIGTPQSYLADSIIYLFNAISGNTNIKTLDISSNLVGNKLLPMLVDLLSATPSIKSLIFDHNNLTDPKQFTSFIESLMKIYCTTFIHYPTFDLEQMINRGLITQAQVNKLNQKYQSSLNSAHSKAPLPRSTSSDKRSMSLSKEAPINISSRSMSNKLFNTRNEPVKAKKVNSVQFFKSVVPDSIDNTKEENLSLTSLTRSSVHINPNSYQQERRVSDLLSDIADTSGLLPPEEQDEIEQVTDNYIYDLEWMCFLNDIPSFNMDAINKTLEEQTSYEALTKALFDPTAQ